MAGLVLPITAYVCAHQSARRGGIALAEGARRLCVESPELSRSCGDPGGVTKPMAVLGRTCDVEGIFRRPLPSGTPFAGSPDDEWPQFLYRNAPVQRLSAPAAGDRRARNGPPYRRPCK